MTDPDPLVLVCADARVYANDVVDHCARCGRVIFFRPHSAAVPVRERICFPCYAASDLGPDDRIAITPETLREVLAYWRARDDA